MPNRPGRPWPARAALGPPDPPSPLAQCHVPLTHSKNAGALAGEYPSDYDVRILEVPKAPPLTGPASQYQDTLPGRKVTWLHHFGVSTDDDFSVIEKIGVPAVTMTIGKYRRMLDDPKAVAEFRAEDTDRTERRYEREAGRKEGRVNTLLEQIAARYGEPEPTPQTVKTVQAGTDRQVCEWSTWIFKADTVAQLLAGPPASERKGH